MLDWFDSPQSHATEEGRCLFETLEILCNQVIALRLACVSWGRRVEAPPIHTHITCHNCVSDIMTIESSILFSVYFSPCEPSRPEWCLSLTLPRLTCYATRQTAIITLQGSNLSDMLSREHQTLVRPAEVHSQQRHCATGFAWAFAWGLVKAISRWAVRDLFYPH